MSTDHITVDEVIVLLRRAGLIPDQWDVATIAGKASRWIADNLLELSEMAGWDAVDQAAHLAEFGSLAAVDFIEQCVIEAGPAAAPWRELQARVDAGEFGDWSPVWVADRHVQGPVSPGAVRRDVQVGVLPAAGRDVFAVDVDRR